MRTVYILLALFFSVGCAVGMEEDATGEAWYEACHIVRQVVRKNVEDFINLRIQSIDKNIQYNNLIIKKCSIQQKMKKEQLTEELTSLQKKKNALTLNLTTFQDSILDEQNVGSFNTVIIKYLKKGEAPEYLGCRYSFRNVDTALKNAGIQLDDETGKLKILTENDYGIVDKIWY